MGWVGGVFVAEIMLNSGLSASLIQQDVRSKAQHIVQIEETKSLQLVTALGEQLDIVEHIRAPVQRISGSGQAGGSGDSGSKFFA